MNRKIFKRIAAALCIIVLLGTTVFAAGGQTAFNQIGVIRWNKQFISAGETLKASNGQSVPSVITYTDAAGGKTNYLSVKSIADMIDTPIEWDASKNSVVFGGSPYHSTSNADQFTPSGPGNSIGPITEIDPNAINMPKEGRHDPWVRTLTANKAGTGQQALTFIPGTINVISITNNLAQSQVMYVSRSAPGSIYNENFTPVVIGPNETITRAFQMAADANELSREMYWSVSGYNPKTDERQEVVRETNITVSTTLYTPVN